MGHMRIGEEQIYEILKAAIFNSELTPGTQLVETSLADAFGVSRTPIRSVLKRLEYESLVKIYPNRGTFVYCPSPEEAEQIFSVRQILEAEATFLAAKYATEEEIRKLEELLIQEKEFYAKNEHRQALRVISDFHEGIIAASRHDYLIRYLRELLSLSHIILTFYDTTEEETPHSIDEHKAILEAIKKKDSHLAKQLADDHIQCIKGDIDYTKKLNHALSIEQVIAHYNRD